MIYLLLIVPHIALIAGLLAFAYYSHRAVVNEDDDGGSYGYRAVQPPPRPPQPLPSGGGLPLSDSTAPRRRLRAGERLLDLHPGRLRRGHAPAHALRETETETETARD